MGSALTRSHPRRSPSTARRDLVDGRKVRKMLSFLQRHRENGWAPRAAFFRVAHRVRAAGYRWQVYCDGYWEPTDKDRQGLEVHVGLIPDKALGSRDWVILQDAGFVRRVDSEMARLGFEVIDRPSDWASTRENAPWLFFDQPVWSPSRYLPVVQRVARWGPR
jgi:hypothetical protein